MSVVTSAMDETEAFAKYVATLGRGPGRSRSLTREEARHALGLVLAGKVPDIQLGACRADQAMGGVAGRPIGVVVVVGQVLLAALLQ